MADDGRGLRFGSVASLYDQYRPPPPSQAADILGDLRGLDVLEVGAGTGIWTRLLVDLGASVTTVEPDDDMRAVLEQRSPSVTSLAGSAEQLAFADSSFDAALVSSAWHWFEQPDATNELARVLRDGAKLFVLWNGFSRDVAWLRGLTELRESPNDHHARPRGWRATFPAAGDFGLFGGRRTRLDLDEDDRSAAVGVRDLLGDARQERRGARRHGTRAATSHR